MTWEQIERAMEFLTFEGARLDARIEKTFEAIDKLVAVTNEDATSIRALARIAGGQQK